MVCLARGEEPPQVVIQRVRTTIRGAVQGVGFRPFVYRLASEMGLTGWVLNSAGGVFIEAEGDRPALEEFVLRLPAESPPRAVIQSLEFSYLDAVGFTGFEIRPSDPGGDRVALVLPDIATCADCLRELFDPKDRRYLYPFTNCTNCGPRYSIIESLPYDRDHTSMRLFRMCPACAREYSDPLDRRFHAQPNACPECGPHVELWDRGGRNTAMGDEAICQTARRIGAGEIVAVKGIGGFHILADARSGKAVQRLRERKRRGEKPFAVMYPSLEAAEQDCEVGRLERRLLLSPESPIVLLRRRDAARGTVAQQVAPGNPYLGAMLPYSPLHHLLMHEVGFPLVATSGNLSEEPICTDEREALHRLQDLADVFLIHNRPIVRHVDDSIVRVLLDRELVLRRARGYAPLPVAVRKPLPQVLAVGGHLKNTVALSVGSNIFISQHIGDLENEEALEAFRKVVGSLCNLYQSDPAQLVSDLHPDYLSTRYALAQGRPVVAVQHHYAHVCACMAENDIEGRVLGVAWDGTGFGADGRVWGGEFLLLDDAGYQRAATLREFPLPGGEKAVREPRRSALGVMYTMLGDSLFDGDDLPFMHSFRKSDRPVLQKMLDRRLNSPLTTSAGRLFDAVASIMGIRQVVDFEGQAAMELEFAAAGGVDENYPFAVVGRDPQTSSPTMLIVDWEPLISAVVQDLRQGVPSSTIAARFHNTLVEIMVEVARRLGESRIVLTGGCFQNRYLTERAVHRLTEAGFRPYWHQRIPPNDGGISLGQVIAAARSPRA
jgi:hydrogenase maturation protein HypF